MSEFLELVNSIGLPAALVVGAIVGIVGIIAASWTRLSEAKLDNLKGVQSARLQQFDGLWSKVGGICTPYTQRQQKAAGGPPYEDPHRIPVASLDRQVLLEAFFGLTKWYQDHGILLDSKSRVWTLILREKCAQVLRDNPEGPFLWEGGVPEWPRLWLIKTAVRISLESSLSVPTLEGRGHWVFATPPHATNRVKKQLRLKFQVVDGLAGARTGAGGHARRKELINQVVTAFATGNVTTLT